MSRSGAALVRLVPPAARGAAPPAAAAPASPGSAGSACGSGGLAAGLRAGRA